MREITLELFEIMLAGEAGIMRHIENLKTGEGLDTHDYPHTCPWQHHIEGCLGELALSKRLGLYWIGKGKKYQRDAGQDDVRARPDHGSRLRLHEKDKDDVIYWHLTGENGYYRFHGWVYGRDGKNYDYWENETKYDRPAFLVPFEMLNPPETHPLWPKTS